MSSHFTFNGRDSPSPPPPYQEMDSAPPTQRNRPPSYVASGLGNNTPTIRSGNVGGGMNRSSSASTTGSSFVRTSGDYRSPQSVSLGPAMGRVVWTVRISMVDCGLRIEQSEIVSSAISVQTHMGTNVELRGGKTMVVSPRGDTHVATVMSGDVQLFKLTLDRRRDEVSLQFGRSWTTKMRNNITYGVTEEFTAEKKLNAVIVQYF